MSETNELLLQILFRNYDEEVARNELIDNKNSQMILLTGTMLTLQATLFTTGLLNEFVYNQIPVDLRCWILYASTIYVASYINSRYLQSTAMINNCRFYYNTAKIHSIFYLDKFSKGSVGATVFKRNQVYDAGSILKVDASKSFVVQNSKFVKNTAVSGILYLGEFKDNKLGYGISHVKVSTCSFYYNRAYCGGSIFSQSRNLNVISTFFLENAATKNGGAIAANNKRTLKLYNCNFRSNRAMYGGAIYSFVKGATASKCYFISNFASRAGSNIYGIPIKISA